MVWWWFAGSRELVVGKWKILERRANGGADPLKEKIRPEGN